MKKCANCGGTGDVSVSVPCPECRPNAARNTTRDRKRAEMFGELVNVAAGVMEAFKGAFETDDAIDGADAVAWLSEFRQRVKPILAKARKLL